MLDVVDLVVVNFRAREFCVILTPDMTHDRYDLKRDGAKGVDMLPLLGSKTVSPVIVPKIQYYILYLNWVTDRVSQVV